MLYIRCRCPHVWTMVLHNYSNQRYQLRNVSDNAAGTSSEHRGCLLPHLTSLSHSPASLLESSYRAHSLEPRHLWGVWYTRTHPRSRTPCSRCRVSVAPTCGNQGSVVCSPHLPHMSQCARAPWCLSALVRHGRYAWRSARSVRPCVRPKPWGAWAPLAVFVLTELLYTTMPRRHSEHGAGHRPLTTPNAQTPKPSK